MAWKRLRANWVAAIVTYGKCYAKTDGRGVKLEATNLPDALRHEHVEIVKLRNNVIAHGGISRFEAGHVDLVIDTGGRVPMFWLQPDYIRLDYLDDSSESVNFAVLLKASKAFVSKKMETLRQRIINTEVITHDLEYWLTKAGHKDG